MMVIGLTGGIASGKSTIAAMLRHANIPVIDADELAREVTKENSPTLSKIAKQFGSGILTDQLSLDRKKLASIVFDDRTLLKKLEAIIHPAIEELRQQQISALERAGHQVCVYVAPLIFETRIDNSLDATILVTAKREIVLERILKRDNINQEDAKKRIDAQLSDDEKRKLADQIIENNGDLDDLYRKLSLAWKTLTGLCLPSIRPG